MSQLRRQNRLLHVSMVALLAACSSSPTTSPSPSPDGAMAADGGATPVDASGGAGDAGGSDASPPLATASIGAQGGSVSVTAAASATLAGASITVPAGALAQTVTIAILASTATVIGPGEQAAGPVADFEPSGTTFTSPATLTLPVSLPTGAAASSLKIAAVEPDGTRQEIAVQSVAGGIATFQANGFTMFGPILQGMGCSTNADCASGAVCVTGTCKAP